METADANSLMPIIVAIIGSQGLIVAALALMAFRVGRLPSREESNALRGEVAANKVELKEDVANVKLEILNTEAKLRQEIAATEAKLRQEIAATEARLRQEIAATEARLRKEITDSKDEVLRGIRHSHQQLMLALVNHTHNANGQAVFTLPPETEPAPADN